MGILDIPLRSLNNATYVSRNSAASIMQMEKLIEFMETRQWLATGHARTAHARDRCKQAWLEISDILNSDGSGATKTWQQWQKYWKDKKGAVKRKCSCIAIARRRTGGGVEEVTQLSHLEQRIVSLLGGEIYAIGERNLEIPVFEDSENANAGPSNSNQSQSILRQEVPNLSYIENNLLPLNLSHVTAVEETATISIISTVPTISQAEEGIEIPRPAATDETISLSSRQTAPTHRISPVLRTNVSRNTPPGGTRRRQEVHSSPRGSRRGITTARRRLLQRSPPSQRRSSMASLTERFIAIEERRTETELLIARSHEMYAQAQQVTAGSLTRLAEAWAAHAQALNNMAEAISRPN